MRLKQNQGSITIGIIILITGMLCLMTFGLEIFLMYSIKGSVERDIKNASSITAVYAIDETQLSLGHLHIDPSHAEIKANEIVLINEKLNTLINVNDINIDITGTNENIILNLTISGNIKRDFIFFNNMEIRANGITKAHFINKVDIEVMTLEDLHNNIAFEVI